MIIQKHRTAPDIADPALKVEEMAGKHSAHPLDQEDLSRTLFYEKGEAEGFVSSVLRTDDKPFPGASTNGRFLVNGEMRPVAPPNQMKTISFRWYNAPMFILSIALNGCPGSILSARRRRPPRLLPRRGRDLRRGPGPKGRRRRNSRRRDG